MKTDMMLAKLSGSLRRQANKLTDGPLRTDFLTLLDDPAVVSNRKLLLGVQEAIEEAIASASPTAETVFESKDAALKYLRDTIFPEVSKNVRLFKTPKLAKDEYIVINRDWIHGLDTHQTHASDRDVNDRLLAAGLPASVEHYPFPGAKAPVKLTVLSAWRRQPETQAARINTLDYIPGGEGIVGHAFNTFKDVSVDAMPDIDVLLFLDHMRDNLCNGNVSYFEYLIRWLAHMVQKPSERPMTGIAIIGDQGNGKGIFIDFIARMLGGRRNANTTTSAKDTKSFNTAVGNKLLVVFDEATFSGDHEQSDFMKKLVTEPYVRIEPKGIDAYEVANYARCFITSNNMESAVPVDIGGRRWLIIECRSMQTEGDYLRDLANKVGNNGEDHPDAIKHFVNGFKHHLQTLDLTGFDTRKLPTQTTGLDTKLHNHYKRDPVYAFLCEWLNAPDLIIYRQIVERDGDGLHEYDRALVWNDEHTFSDYYAVFQDMCKSSHGKPIGANRIGRELAKYGVECFSKGGNVRHVKMPTPRAVLNALRKSARFDSLVSPEQEALIAKWTDEGAPDGFKASMIINREVRVREPELVG